MNALNTMNATNAANAANGPAVPSGGTAANAANAANGPAVPSGGTVAVPARPKTTPARRFRIASLLVPMFLVTLIVSDEHSGALLHTAGFALYGAWLALVSVLGVRLVHAFWRESKMPSHASPWATVDILTASGTSMLWTGVGALGLARVSGWASLSVLGVLGVGTVMLAALWTAIAACGARPWRRATVARSIIPASAVEGDPLREEIAIDDLDAPAGMRLFVMGRAQKHGAVSRYVVEGKHLGGQVKLAGQIGEACRGEHHVAPLSLWFVDVLGLTRTPVVHFGATELTVLPKPIAVDGAQKLLGAGGDAAIARPTKQAPTDGVFRIREYVPGDDARRIHWVRAAQREDLVVRLPDEVPPAEPSIRLVLDNELAGAELLTCRAADELLDALVRVWLGVGKALAAQGTRVTMVVVANAKGRLAPVERRLNLRGSQDIVKLGARVAWQAGIALEAVLGVGAGAPVRERQVVISARPRRFTASEGRARDDIRWVVVPEAGFTTLDDNHLGDEAFDYRYPVGSPENRRSRRERERHAAQLRWQDRAFFSQVMTIPWADRSQLSGDHVARLDRARGRVVVEVIA